MLTHGSRQPRSWLIFDVGQKRTMRNLLIAFIVVAAVGSALAQTPFSKDELEVLRRHFATEAKDKTPVIVQGTSSIGIREPGRDWKARLRSSSAKQNADIQQAIEDFIAKNEDDSSLEHLQLEGVRITIVSVPELRAVFSSKVENGWEIFRRRFSCSTLHKFSRVGFSKDRRLAIYFAYAQHDWTNGGGRFYVVRLREGQWTEDESVNVGWSIVS